MSAGARARLGLYFATYIAALHAEGVALENESIIVVQNLTKAFGDFVAVDNITFDMKKGEIFGLLGPNGAGKSTVIRMLSTLTRPTKGTATIGGFDIVKQDNEVRKLIGIVSEKMIMYNRLTAKENLWFFGNLFGMPNRFPKNQRFSLAVRRLYIIIFSETIPISFLTSLSCFTMSNPPIVAVPFVGLVRVESIRMTVLFPAPLGPSRPKISPFFMSNVMLSTATKSPKAFVKFWTTIIDSFSKATPSA